MAQYQPGEYVTWGQDPEHARLQQLALRDIQERAMSNLWFNLRIGGLFIQISRDRPLVGVHKGKEVLGSRLRLSRPEGRPKRGEPWIELYELRWPW